MVDMQVDEGSSAVVDHVGPSNSFKSKGKGKLVDEKRTATLHRIRFLDYIPSSILAIALTPSTYDPILHYPYLPSFHKDNGREILAVGRQNGEIEIYTWIGGEGRDRQRQHTRGSQKTALLSERVQSGNRQGWVLERVGGPIQHEKYIG